MIDSILIEKLGFFTDTSYLHRSHHCRHHRHPLNCIVPDYLLTQIAQRGSPTQREAALTALLSSNSFRSARLDATAQARGAGWHTLGAKAARYWQAMANLTYNPQICIFDAQGTQRLPGVRVRCGDDPPTGDAAVDEAYDGLLATYDLYYNAYQRDSIDNNGLPLNGTVHFSQQYGNAFWDGAQMVFGDGDGELFNRFTIAIDIMGHELTHGVTEFESGLVYFFQPGALNESISDVFGTLVKQYALQQTVDEADWLIGAGLLTDNVQRPDPTLPPALRSMMAPGTAYDDPVLGKDPQPALMQDFVRTLDDNGGVHINSGIPNYAFYLAASYIGGYAWEKAGRIWYETLLDPRLRPRARFTNFASLTILVAGNLYGSGSDEQRAVQEAWQQVGVLA